MSLTHQLNSLEASGLIILTITRPEIEYLFRHGLIQDAAYASLLKAERKRLHQTVGEALEKLYDNRQGELAGLLAHHFAVAGERNKAVHYSREAAHQAEARYAYEEAVQYLRSALNLMEGDEQSGTKLALLEELADVYQLLREGPQALALYQQALELWRKLAGVNNVIALRLHRKIIQTVSDIRWATRVEQQEEADRIGIVSRASLEDALQLLEDQAPHRETVYLLKTLSLDAWRNRLPPNWEAAERHALAALNVAEQLNDPAEVSTALGALAVIYLARGLLQEYLQIALRRLASSADARFDHVRERLDSLRTAGSALMYVGEYTQALTHLQEAESLAAQIQAVGEQFNALSLQLQCTFRLDRWDDAIRIEAAWQALEQRYPRERVGAPCFALALGASVHALRGNFDKAHMYRKASYDYMIANTATREQWQRNQHY
ncbi:MAG: hypothetical protein L0332_04685 [Chloroflexi bacterium]|nr:hypothetical protein [Chloroflexota bacterium]MCI0578503.1 hypothetical protein [Chloroflexota bacterium]MCI0648480.1 hypothetical protein [Chloroflexota bacterium]MCI0726004.1 hypothetical protein [Chloroflexota bacterium]